jgi:hypothetical protein
MGFGENEKGALEGQVKVVNFFIAIFQSNLESNHIFKFAIH